MRSSWAFFPLVLAFLGFLAGGLSGQLKVEGFDPKADLFPVVGKASLVTLGNGTGATKLRVTYRPGSAVSHVEKADMVEGKVAWIPTAPGIVQLEAGTMVSSGSGAGAVFKVLGSKVVSVRSPSMTLGFVIMILAGLILFGGAAFSIRALLSS